MKKLLPILLLFGFGTAVNAGGMTTRHQTSLQQVQTPTITQTQRTGNSYSISGNNVSTSYTYCSAGCDGNSPTNSTVNGGIGRVTFNDNGTTNMVNVAASQGVVCTSGCEGNSPTYGSTGTFSFANSYTQGDANNAAGTNSTVTAGASGASTAPGTVTSGHTVTLAGSQTSGTTVTGQFISEVTVFN
tara:strand:+ start:55 stop:615 length:561 start_codon:yes stop_codon:yes gene_type:complete